MTTVSLPRNFLVNARGLTIADSASAVWSFNPNTNTLTLAAGGGATGFANPTAKVGTAAVNGAATTAMRSDGAPALDQTIAPVWTGAHTFTPGAGTAITITAFSAGTPCISMTDKGSGVHFGNSGGGSFDLGLLAGVGSPDAYIFQRANANLIIGTNGATRVNIAGTGAITANAPASGDTLTLTNVAGANALTVNGNAAGTAVVRLNTQATTGVQTATFTATNKPGSGTTAPTKWIPINVDGTTMYVPAWL